MRESGRIRARGKLRSLLVLLRDHPDLVEADLDQFYHRDLRDLWRFDEEGRRKLTHRMIYVRIKELPHTAALAAHFNGGKQPWTLPDHLLADIWAATANQARKKGTPFKEHPARPKPKARGAHSPKRDRAMQAAQRRRAAIAARRRLRPKEV